jgi:hypothetical protein
MNITSDLFDASGVMNRLDQRVLGLDVATHALLGNYDVVGRSFDNLGMEQIKTSASSMDIKSFVVDPGASLLYRGTGGTKEGTEFEFGGNATKTLFDLIINNRGIKQPYLQNANTLFGNITVNDLVTSIQKMDYEFSKMKSNIEEAVSLAYNDPNEIEFFMQTLSNRVFSLKKLRSDMLRGSEFVPFDADFDMSVTDFFQSFPQLLNRFNGGIVPKFESQGVPAMLHGGEYVVNAKAVKNIGFAALEAMNNMRYKTPKSPSYSGTVNQPTSSNSNVHIYVDNFIGERAWFESMMKDYNVKVAPQNQKSAGLNNTTISTYSGINRGL